MSTAFSEQSALLGQPRVSVEHIAHSILAQPHGEYTEIDVREVIVRTYFEVCQSIDLDPVVAIAQMVHETGNLTSFWSARPQRNPAGIGVTGQHQRQEPEDKTNWAFNTQRQRWEVGLSFASWKDGAVVAHVGRLLAFVLPKGSGTLAQQALVESALHVRPLPTILRGSAQTLKQLGARHNPTNQGWASPGDDYGARVASVARRLTAMQG